MKILADESAVIHVADHIDLGRFWRHEKNIVQVAGDIQCCFRRTVEMNGDIRMGVFVEACGEAY